MPQSTAVQPTAGRYRFRQKLTPDDVRAIRRRLAAGESLAVIAADYDVTRGAIGDIRQRRSWVWVTDEPSLQSALQLA